MNVLWVSKHDPVLVQIDHLKEKIPDAKVIIVKKVFANAEEVIELARQYNAKIIVPVLPLSFIMRLVDLARKEGIIVLYSEMELVRTTNQYPDPHEIDHYREVVVPARDKEGNYIYKIYRFKAFKVIKGIRFELEDF